MSRNPTRSQNRDFVKSFARDRDAGTISLSAIARTIYAPPNNSIGGGLYRWGHAAPNPFTLIPEPVNPGTPTPPPGSPNQEILYFPGDIPGSPIGHIFGYPETQPEDVFYAAGTSGGGAYFPRPVGDTFGEAALWAEELIGRSTHHFRMTIRVWGLVPLVDWFTTPASVTENGVTAYKSAAYWWLQDNLPSEQQRLNTVTNPITGLAVRHVPLNSVPEGETVPDGLHFINRVIRVCGTHQAGNTAAIQAVIRASFDPNCLIRRYTTATNYTIVAHHRIVPNSTLRDPTNPVGTPTPGQAQTLFDFWNSLSAAAKNVLIFKATGLCAHLVSIEEVPSLLPITMEETTREFVSDAGSALIP